MRLVLALVAGLLVSGCASLPDTINALAKDDASVCVSLSATLYGHVIVCRTNTPGAAILDAKKDAMTIQHRGR